MFGDELKTRRMGQGLSQRRLAERIHYSHSMISLVESGNRAPTVDFAQALDRYFQTEFLFQGYLYHGIPNRASVRDDPSYRLVSTFRGEASVDESTLLPDRARRSESPAQLLDGDDMNRKQFLKATMGVGAGLFLLGNKPHVPIRTLDSPKRVDANWIEHLFDAADRLYTSDQDIGGGSLIDSGLRQYHRARSMLDEAEYDGETGRHLASATGELAVCAGWLSYDESQHRRARQLYTEALLLAQQADDRGLAVRAMEKMTLQSVFFAHSSSGSGDAREAIRLSLRAGEMARGSHSPRVHALLAVREASAHAAAGDSHVALKAMTRAWREVDRGIDDEKPAAWLIGLTASEIVFQEARVRAALGDPTAAIELYRSSLDAGLSPRNSANYRAQLALALAKEGDVAASLDEATKVLPALEAGVTSPRTVALLRSTSILVGSDRCSAELFERLDQIVAEPTE